MVLLGCSSMRSAAWVWPKSSLIEEKCSAVGRLTDVLPHGFSRGEARQRAAIAFLWFCFRRTHDAARRVGEHDAMSIAASNASLLDQPLADVSGNAASLRQFVITPLVVVFVRHYGCIFCRERAAEVLASRSAIEAKGARIVFVGTGLPAMASEFAAQQAAGLPVLSDPTRRIFELAGMRRGLSTILRLATLLNSWRAFRRGHRQTKVQGDPWQQGGVLVLDRKGEIAHAQRDSAAGDSIDWRRVIEAIPAAR